MKNIGISKVSDGNKITVVKEVALKLGIQTGDTVGFFETKTGDVIMKKVSIQVEG